MIAAPSMDLGMGMSFDRIPSLRAVREPDYDGFKDIIRTLLKASREIQPKSERFDNLVSQVRAMDPNWEAKPALEELIKENPKLAQELQDVGVTYRMKGTKPLLITQYGDKNPFKDLQFTLVRYAAINPGKSRLAVAFDGLLELNNLDDELEDMVYYGLERRDFRRIKRTGLIEYIDENTGNLVFAVEKDRIKVNANQFLDNSDRIEDYLNALVEVVDHLHEKKAESFQHVIRIPYHQFSIGLSLFNPERAQHLDYVTKVIDAIDKVYENGIGAQVTDPLGEREISGDALFRYIGRKNIRYAALKEKLGDHIAGITISPDGDLFIRYDAEIDTDELKKRLGSATEYSIDGGPWILHADRREMVDAIKEERLITRRMPGSYLLRNTPHAYKEIHLSENVLHLAGQFTSLAQLTKYGIRIPKEISVEERGIAVAIASEIYKQMLLVTYGNTHYAGGEKRRSALTPDERGIIIDIAQQAKSLMEGDPRTRPLTFDDAFYSVQNYYLEQAKRINTENS